MAETRVIDDNMHFLPTNLFTNEEVLHGFLYSAPVTFGMKAYLGKTPDGTKDQVILEYPEGKQILNYVDGDYTLRPRSRQWTRLASTSRCCACRCGRNGCPSTCARS